jgi:single-strand DNA-binding protein
MSNPIVTISGRIGQDPDPIKYAGGTGLRLRIATNDRTKNANTGEWEDKDTSWWTVKAWKTVAEDSLNTLKKGDEVIVIGKMIEESYIDKEGNTRNTYEINAEKIAVTTRTLKKNLVGISSKPEDNIWNAEGDVPF